MSGPVSSAPPTSPRSGAPPRPGRTRRGVPRWGWVLPTAAAAVAIVALLVAVLGSRGTGTTTPAAAVPPPVPGASGPGDRGPGPLSANIGAGLVDGCLGGRGPDLDAVMLAAQQQAPLTVEGAASFAATFARWVMQTPSPPHFADTAQKVLSSDATPSVRSGLTSGEQAGRVGWNLTADTGHGSYHVESFTGAGTSASAVITYQVGWSGTKDGVPADPVMVSSTLRLTAAVGTWHVRETAQGRTQADMAQVGAPYAGGC